MRQECKCGAVWIPRKVLKRDCPYCGADLIRTVDTSEPHVALDGPAIMGEQPSDTVTLVATKQAGSGDVVIIGDNARHPNWWDRIKNGALNLFRNTLGWV